MTTPPPDDLGDVWQSAPRSQAGHAAPGQAPAVGPAARIRANRHPFGTSFAVGLLLFGVAAVLLHLIVGLTAYDAGRLLTTVWIVPAVIVAFIARTRPHRWRWWRYLPLQAAVALLLLALAAFSDISDRPDAQTPVNALPVMELKRESRAAAAGIFTPAESDCMVEKLVRRPDITVGQIEEYFRAPQPGPVESAHTQIVPSCIDPAAVVEPAPLHPGVRQLFVNGLKVGLPDITDEEADCVLDGLLARGVTPRELNLSGYDDQLFQKLAPEFEAVSSKCLAPAAPS